jgi:hypothetical protein
MYVIYRCVIGHFALANLYYESYLRTGIHHPLVEEFLRRGGY